MFWDSDCDRPKRRTCGESSCSRFIWRLLFISPLDILCRCALRRRILYGRKCCAYKWSRVHLILLGPFETISRGAFSAARALPPRGLMRAPSLLNAQRKLFTRERRGVGGGPLYSSHELIPSNFLLLLHCNPREDFIHSRRTKTRPV